MTNSRTIYCGVTDRLNPELQAMLQANYSRTDSSIISRLPKDEPTAIKLQEALRRVYNEYGHKSVGQLGHTTIYFEGISMLAALAIEVAKLFNGQETSTRYMNFATRSTVDGGNSLVAKWQDIWRAFYIATLAELIPTLTHQYPMPADASLNKYQNAIAARAFDITGGILPPGFTTCVAFTGTFDTINDALTWLSFHPLVEVREVAEIAAEAMMQAYPNAAYSLEKHQMRGRHRLYPKAGASVSAQEPRWLTHRHVQAYYLCAPSFEHDRLFCPSQQMRYEHLLSMHSKAQADKLAHHSYGVVDDIHHAGRQSNMLLTYRIAQADLLTHSDVWSDPNMQQFSDRLYEYGGATRVKYDSFPNNLSEGIRFRMASMMDMRSYRDLHRHRNGDRPMPLLTMSGGLHSYYTDNLPEHLSDRFKTLYAQQETEFALQLVQCSGEVDYNEKRLQQQYAIPMGSQVPYYYGCDLNQLLYLQELRTDKTVHQTLRIEMQAAYHQLNSLFPDLMVHADMAANNFTLRRGSQTFTEPQGV